MSKGKHPKSVFVRIPEPKQEIERCVYCGTSYDKKEDHKPEKGHCPNCGGTVTEEMGEPKYTIGRVYDEYRNSHFQHEKITNREFLEQAK